MDLPVHTFVLSGSVCTRTMVARMAVPRTKMLERVCAVRKYRERPLKVLT